jgi:primosomal protein N' (replication factor Y)
VETFFEAQWAKATLRVWDVLLAEVALPVPLNRAFTYLVPQPFEAAVAPGARVICSFGARRLVGVVLALREGQPTEGVKSIARVVDEHPAIPEDLLAFLRDLASYYFSPIGEVVRLALPPIDRATASMLRDRTLFDEARGVAVRRVQWACAQSRSEPAEALRGRSSAILAHVRATGATPVVELERRWGGSARQAVRRLARLGLLSLEAREAPGDPFFAEPAAREAMHEATPAQATAIDAIGAKVRERRATTFLLHGVTGSGKTEVYLRAIAVARDSGRGAIVLVPEIALTPQLVARFRARFGDDVAVLHSALTPRERHMMWRRLRTGEIDVAIGARSALFAPVRALGLVVVDEEHDPSFKQEEGVRYHARDMAILRAHRVGGVCLLGSATPSLESEQLARTGKATKLRLTDRARAQPMPRVELVDLRRVGPSQAGDRRISLPLHRAIERTLDAREQAILFLNRRGFAPSVRCEACGRLATCEACSVAVTFHKGDGVVRCHYCDFQAPLATRCSLCGSASLALEGLGTERLEETLTSAFPGARVARLDRDVASGKAAAGILAKMRNGEVDVLVGTQMVAKGHDLPNVTLVGVINADAALSIPDYRASERAFQLLVQVAGRAGRGERSGQVVVQTWDPEHPAIALAARHDVDTFVERELADRRELGYPPTTRAALLRVDSTDEADARAACSRLAQVARSSDDARAGRVLVQGPAPAPIARVRGRWRFRVMLRAAERAALRAVLYQVDEARGSLPRGVRASIDVDPVQLL